MSRPSSPSSTCSTASAESMYGAPLAALLSPSVFDTLDDGLLFSPTDAFAEVCWASAIGDAAQPRNASAASSSFMLAKANARRSAWIHGSLPSSDEESAWSEEDEQDDAASMYTGTSRSPPPAYAPWLELDEPSSPMSVIQFRRPSGASSFYDLDLEARPRTRLDLAPLESASYFPPPSPSASSPATEKDAGRGASDKARKRVGFVFGALKRK